MVEFIAEVASGNQVNLIDRVLPCPEIDFGPVGLSKGQKTFCRQLNQEILWLCESLPASIQVDALSFLMRYAGISFNREINFFRNYYIPAWSVIYWLIDACPDDKQPAEDEVNNAIRAHSMAMFLHSLDDHLNDGQIAADHLSLLLRSQAWMRMNDALDRLTDGVDNGIEVVKGFIDDYYAAICSSEEIDTLDNYCNRFRKQMATWLAVPATLSKKIAGDNDFTKAVQSAYESFGIAWRLLDDLQDMEKDRVNGARSSVYYCLPGKVRRLWDRTAVEANAGSDDGANTIWKTVSEKGIVTRIRQRICAELESAATIAGGLNLTGLQKEFDCLLQPLRDTQNPL